MSKSPDKIDQIRRAKNGTTKKFTGPDVLTCPLCGEYMIENGALRTHVANSEDGDHRHKRLNDDLEPVTDWEALEW